jgi:tetratricopeptide (TPR) repeat protein
VVVGLIGVAAVVTGTRLYRIRRSCEQPALFALGTTLVGASIGWFVLPVAGHGGYLSIVLVLVGFEAGQLWPESLSGLAVALTMSGLPADRLALVVLSVAAGYAWVLAEYSDWRAEFSDWLTDWLVVYSAPLRRWRTTRWISRALSAAAKGGQVSGPWASLPPPTWMDRARLPAVQVAGLAPLATGVMAGGGPWVAVTGLLVTASFELKILGFRGMTRKFRSIVLGGVLLWAAIIVLVAGSPVGWWVVRVASGTLPETPVWPILAAFAVLGAGLVLAKRGRPDERLIRPENRWIVLASIAFGPVEDGMFPFLVGGVFHRATLLLTIGAVLAVGQVLLHVSSLARGVRPMLKGNIVALLEPDGLGYDELWGWVYDSVLTRPRKPDLDLLWAMAEDAMPAAHGRGTRMHDLLGSGRMSRRVDDSLRWLEYVTRVVGIIEQDVLPRWSEADANRLRPVLAMLRAGCAGARANLYQYVNLREEAASAYQQAVEIDEAAGLTNLAAGYRVALALVIGNRLRRRAEAIALVETVLADPHVASVIRRRGCLVGMLVSREFGDEEAVTAFRRTRDLLPASRRDYFAAVADMSPQVSGRLTKRRTARMMARLFQEQEFFFDDSSPQGTGPAVSLGFGLGPIAVPERELLTAGQLLAGQGKLRRALAVLEDAAQLAEREGHTEFLLRSRNAIADIHLERGNRAAAWQNLSSALNAHQHIRRLPIDPEVRGDVGGLYAETFERAINLLVADGSPPDRAWPSRPTATAFELGELARSRVFLELLGERLEAGSADEQSARAALETARQHLAQCPVPEREERLAEVREAARALDRVYERQLASNPQAAEYVALRQGTPTSYEEIRRLLGRC